MTEDETAARLAEFEADNARLRRLLDARNVPGELRHRLRSTLAVLRAVIRESAKSKSDVEIYAAHLEDRLDALVRAQAAADEFGEVDLASIVANELQHYGATEGDQVTLAGPDVFLKPRAAQVVTLAMHELAVNAVEHGPLMDKAGKVDVAWQLDLEGAGVTLNWKESATARPAEAAAPGFGMSVLQGMLRYELQATATVDFEPDGLRCAISFPLPDRVGRIAPPG